MNNINQQVNKLKLLLYLSLVNKLNQREIEPNDLIEDKENNYIIEETKSEKEATATNYDSNDNHNEEKSNQVIDNRNLCPSVLICENLCYENEMVFKPFGEQLYIKEGKERNYQYATHNGINEETGLTYAQARYMDNSTGRFISSDMAKDGLNWYVYCDNNPTTFIDPDGNWYDNFGVGSSFSNWGFSSLYSYNTSFYNWRPSSFSTYNFRDYARSDWLPKFYCNETISTKTRFNLNETGTNFREYTWTANRFKSEFGYLTTPSLSSLNNINRFDSKYFQINLGKYNYNDNWATNIPKIINNSSVNLFKGVVDTFINAPLYTGQYIADNGIGESFNQIGKSFTNIWDGMKEFGGNYVNSWKNFAGNPSSYLGNLGNNLISDFKRPETYEGITTLAMGLMVGKFGKSGIGDIYKAGDKVDDVAGVTKTGSKLPNDEIYFPTKRGEVPISKKDKLPVELHHAGQNPAGPFIEMHPSDHRYGQNYKINHPNYISKSKIDRVKFRQQKREYWQNEWDTDRFKPLE